MNYRLIFFIVLIGFIVFPSEVEAQTTKIKTVVIDAGHGGKDAGAVGKKSKEKDITLAVAKKTGDYIKKKYPEFARRISHKFGKRTEAGKDA